MPDPTAGDRATIIGTGNTTYDGKVCEVLDVLRSGRRLVAVDGYTSSTGLRLYLPRNLALIAAPAPAPVPDPVPVPVPVPVPAPSNPSGVAMPAAEPAGWRRIFADDFNTPVALGSFPAAAPQWGAYKADWTGSAKNSYYDAPKTVSQHDGMLDIWCRTLDGRRISAAPIPRLPVDPAVELAGTDGSWSGYYTLSARIAVRVKVDVMPGWKTAWLLWPKSDTWPRDGEIDFPEGDCRDGHHVGGFMHRMGATLKDDQDAWDGGIVYADGQWHTYVIEWRAGQSCQFFRDGVAGPRWTSRVPSTPMRYVLQTETEYGTGVVPAADVQGHVLCDWITYAVAV